VSGWSGSAWANLTLRLRGAFFSIATLALAVVLQTLVVNWNYVGGSRGAYVIRPAEDPVLHLPYIQYLFLVMLVLALVAIVIARHHRALQTRLRVSPPSATTSWPRRPPGVPTLKLKLIATVISGALMGMAGAPFPYYIGYLQPTSAFALEYAVNSIAMR